MVLDSTCSAGEAASSATLAALIARSFICFHSLSIVLFTTSSAAGAVASSCFLLIWASPNSPSGVFGEVDEDLLRSLIGLSDLKRSTTALRPIDWARVGLGQFETNFTRKSRSVSLRSYVLPLRSESDKFECMSEAAGLISAPLFDINVLD